MATVIPKDAQERQACLTIAAAIAMHALLSRSMHRPNDSAEYVSAAFEYAEAFLAESERRAKAAGVA